MTLQPSGTLPPECVQDYPRPPLLEPVAAVLEVRFAGQVIAATTRGWRVCETHHPPSYYLPRADVAEGALVPAGGGSVCEWKGRAAYWDVTAGGRTAPRAAWSYTSPTAAFAPIAGHVAFYAGPMDACTVGGVRVEPQPGGFYGGWVTPNLSGRIKGAPGTLHW